MKNRSDLEAEAMRLIAAVNDNIVLDAKEVIVQALDRMQVEGAKWAEQEGYAACVCPHPRLAIQQALENREKICH